VIFASFGLSSRGATQRSLSTGGDRKKQERLALGNWNGGRPGWHVHVPDRSEFPDHPTQGKDASIQP